MESFKNYYERLSLLNINKATNTLGAHDPGKFYPSDGILCDITSPKVTPEYFNKIDFATSQLIEFYNDVIARPSTHAILYDYISETKKRDYSDLKLCFLIDMLRCYEGLSHPTNLSSPEGVALLLLLSKSFFPGFFFNYGTLSKVPECVINLDAIVPYIVESSEEIGNKDGEIIISKLLHDINPKADILYRQLIYKFCEAVSEVDGIISQSEKEWLMAVLRLDDNDGTNDIIMDSIFTRNN